LSSRERRRFESDVTPMAFLPSYVRPRIERLFSGEARNVLYDEFYAALDDVIGDTLARRIRPFISKALDDLSARVRDEVTSAVIRELERRGVFSSSSGSPVSRSPSVPSAPSPVVAASPSVQRSSKKVVESPRPADSVLLPDETKLGSEEFEETEREGRNPFEDLKKED